MSNYPTTAQCNWLCISATNVLNASSQLLLYSWEMSAISSTNYMTATNHAAFNKIATLPAAADLQSSRMAATSLDDAINRLRSSKQEGWFVLPCYSLCLNNFNICAKFYIWLSLSLCLLVWCWDLGLFLHIFATTHSFLANCINYCTFKLFWSFNNRSCSIKMNGKAP